MSDVDASLAWEAESKSKEDLFQLGADIFLYAMESQRVSNHPSPDPARSGAAPPPLQRLPRPDRAAEEKAIDLVRAAYGPYPADASGLHKLADQFVVEARLTTDDYTTRYALLHEARIIASQIGEYELALPMIPANTASPLALPLDHPFFG